MGEDAAVVQMGAKDAGADAPRIGAATFFLYYADLRAAIRWYARHLGLVPVFDDGWVAILGREGTAINLGLVNGTDGSHRLTAQSDKAALIAFETPDLESWYERLSAEPEVTLHRPISVGAKGHTEMFQILDPGGYIVEFYRWRKAADA